MLSKQVKARRNVNCNKRYLSAVKELRVLMKDVLARPNGYTLLAGRRLYGRRDDLLGRVIGRPSQVLLSSKHLVLVNAVQ